MMLVVDGRVCGEFHDITSDGWCLRSWGWGREWSLKWSWSSECSWKWRLNKDGAREQTEQPAAFSLFWSCPGTSLIKRRLEPDVPNKNKNENPGWITSTSSLFWLIMTPKKGLLFVFWSSLNLWERERKQSNPKSQSLFNYICWHRLHHEFVPNEQSGLHYFLGWSFASFFTFFLLFI